MSNIDKGKVSGDIHLISVSSKKGTTVKFAMPPSKIFSMYLHACTGPYKSTHFGWSFYIGGIPFYFRFFILSLSDFSISIQLYFIFFYRCT